MARRPYVHLAGNLSGWPKGTVPGPGMMKRLDQFSNELVNGEDGGEWEPEEPIVVGPYVDADGAYVAPTIDLNDDSELTGDIVTVRGNGEGDQLVKPGLVLQGAGYPGFQANRSREVVIGFSNFVEADGNLATNVARVVMDDTHLAPKHVSTLSSTRIISVPFPIRAQHRGATISNVALRFIVPGIADALPGTMLRFRICRITGGTSLLPLHTTAGVYDANGNYVDDAATVAAFLNNGQVRTLNYVPDQNHTNLDPDNDWFLIQMRPYSTPGPLGLMWLSATVTLTDIATLRE